MSLIRAIERRALSKSIDPAGLTQRSQYANFSGEQVTELTAFASSAVLSSVTLLADCIAAMPVDLVVKHKGRISILEPPSLLERPNTHQTMFEFVHQFMLTLALLGTNHIYAPHAAGAYPDELRNLHPKMVSKMEMLPDGSIEYTIGKVKVTSRDIKTVHWIIMANQMAGIVPIDALKNTIGMGLAMDRFLAQFYGEGGTPSSVLETEQTLTIETAEIARTTWEDSHQRRRRPAVLTGGLKWRPIVTSAADMEMLDHREAIVRDIARVWRIPLNLINGSGGNSQTYQNVESAGINFVRFTLLAFMRRIEDAISLMLPIGQRIRFNADEFQRSDLLTRVRAYQVQIMDGTLSPNEARQMENREPYIGGDQFFIALAGAPLSGLEGDDSKPLLGIDADPPKRADDLQAIETTQIREIGAAPFI